MHEEAINIANYRAKKVDYDGKAEKRTVELVAAGMTTEAVKEALKHELGPEPNDPGTSSRGKGGAVDTVLKSYQKAFASVLAAIQDNPRDLSERAHARNAMAPVRRSDGSLQNLTSVTRALHSTSTELYTHAIVAHAA